MKPRVPDFIYIGPPKTGTTFLRSYFSYHPEIHWARKAQAFSQRHSAQQQYINDIATSVKEKCYIDVFEALALGVKVLNEGKFSKMQFDPNIETPREVAYYDIEEVFRDIKHNLPNARILFSMRNQIDWMRSSYAHFITRLPYAQRRFSDFLHTFQGKGHIEAGHYHRTIELLNEIFGSQNIHVCVLELNKLNQDDFLHHLCDFLQVNYLPFPKEHQQRNKGRSMRAVTLLRTIPRGLREFAAGKLPGIGKTGWINEALETFSPQDLLSKEEIRGLENRYRKSNSISQTLLSVQLNELGYPT